MSPTAPKEAPVPVEVVEGRAPCTADATIHERMIAVLAELPALGKDDYNKQQQFHFRSHDSVMNALNPLLAKHGVFVVPDVIERVTDQRTTSGGKAMYEVNLHVRFTFYGLAGDDLSGSAWGEGTDMGDKSTNKAMTAAFKYLLVQSFGISSGDTADSDRDTNEDTSGRSSARGRGGSRSGGSQGDAGGGVKLPGSWSEWSARMAALGVSEAEQPFWLTDASSHLDKDGKWAAAKKLLVELTERGEVAFDGDARAVMQGLVAKVFDGFAAPGPPWRLAPGELDLPTREEWDAAHAEQDAVVQADAESGAASDDDIPF